MTMKRNLLLAAAIVLSAQMAAALTAEELAATLQANGYSYIAIQTGTSQIAVRAYKDGQAVRSVYDAATGALLATRAETREAPDGADTGVRLRTGERDFVAVAADGTVTPLGRAGGDGERPPRPEGATDNHPEGEGHAHPEGAPEGRPDHGPHDHPEGAEGRGEGGGRPPRG